MVVITMISDDTKEASPAFPPIGATVNAALLGYTAVGEEPRLSVRPSDVEGLM